MTAKHAVTDEQKARYLARENELRSRFLKGILDPQSVLGGLQLMIEEGRPIETITVPDLPAAALLAVVKEQAGLTYLNPAYQQYGFVRGERGKTYEVLKWKPGRGVSSDAVREHFRALGFAGNAAAFVSWVARNHPVGWFVSIPEDDECFVGGGDLQTPNFYRDDSDRELYLSRLAGDWRDDNVFVAFREIPQK